MDEFFLSVPRKFGSKCEIRRVPIIGSKVTILSANDYSWMKYIAKKIDGSLFPRLIYMVGSIHLLLISKLGKILLQLFTKVPQVLKKENASRTVKDVKIISCGKIVENNKTVGECRSALCDVLGELQLCGSLLVIRRHKKKVEQRETIHCFSQ